MQTNFPVAMVMQHNRFFLTNARDTSRNHSSSTASKPVYKKSVLTEKKLNRKFQEDERSTVTKE